MNLQWNPDAGYFDLALTAAGGIDSGIGNGGKLQTLIWGALFSDGLADAADLTPDLGTDRRGWWGDSGVAPDEGLARSLLWLYRRAKKSDQVLLDIQRTAQDVVQPLIDAGFFSKIDITAVWLPVPLEGVRLKGRYYEPSGASRDWQADMLWGGVAG